MEQPLISVIVPVYNVSGFIEKCVRSIFAQTYKNLEIIIVDDGSTDGSSEICDKLRTEDERVVLIHQENGGASAARNRGLDICKGEYISFVDGDDYTEPTMIEDLYILLINYDADIAQCDYNVIENGTVSDGLNITDPVITVFDRSQIEKLFSGFRGPDVIQWNKLYKKGIFEGLRFPEGMFLEDEFIFYKEFERCNVFVHTSKRLYDYVMRDGSAMKTLNVAKRQMYIMALAERVEYFSAKGFSDRAYAAYSLVWREYRTIGILLGDNDDYRTNIAEFKRKCHSIMFSPKYFAFLMRKIKNALFARFKRR